MVGNITGWLRTMTERCVRSWVRICDCALCHHYLCAVSDRQKTQRRLQEDQAKTPEKYHDRLRLFELTSLKCLLSHLNYGLIVS